MYAKKKEKKRKKKSIWRGNGIFLKKYFDLN